MVKVRRTPANKDKPTGKKWPLSRSQVLRLLDYFAREHRSLNRLRNLTLLVVGISTALRGVDLVRLTYDDVANQYREIYPKFDVIQQKKKHKGRKKKSAELKVTCVLLPLAQFMLHQYIVEANKKSGDYLFTSHYNSTRSLKAGSFRKTFKKWLRAVGIDPTNYGTHSLRRTQGKHLLDNDIGMRVVQTLKGHGSLFTTENYYDLPVLQLEEAMRKFPVLPKTLTLEEPPDAKQFAARHKKKLTKPKN